MIHRLGTYNVVKSYGGKVVIGYQLPTSAMMNPIYMGDPDGVTALQKSLQMGVDAKAQFLEVYEPDVLILPRKMCWPPLPAPWRLRLISVAAYWAVVLHLGFKPGERQWVAGEDGFR